MGHSYQVVHPTSVLRADVTLPGSKSESNRLLVLNQLAGEKTRLVNLSGADDTQLLGKLFKRGGKMVDVKDCGTALRFLIPFYCLLNRNKIITGSPRLCRRPVGPLVEALQGMGFKLHYAREEGYPPVEVIPVENKYPRNRVAIDGSDSSQYVSALALVAPWLSGGLTIDIRGKVASRPYINLTLHLMNRFGFTHQWDKNVLAIPAQRPVPPAEVVVESDWSAASYWYSMAALAQEADIVLHGLSAKSRQGDKVLMEWMRPFGVETAVEEHGIRITGTGQPPATDQAMDFTNHPDLAMSFLVLAAAKNVRLQAAGLDALRLKESDRLEGLVAELRKINARLEPDGDVYLLKPNYRSTREKIETANDHRMVMAFAPLALAGGVKLDQPLSVTKSYPGFWDDMKRAGFTW